MPRRIAPFRAGMIIMKTGRKKTESVEEYTVQNEFLSPKKRGRMGGGESAGGSPKVATLSWMHISGKPS